MTPVDPGQVTASAARKFLTRYHGAPVGDLEPLRGGYWSTAFGYSAAGRDLVVRFGRRRDGFEMDRAATTFTGPDLPVPEVLDIGDAFDGSFAVSVRRRGRFLEEIAVADAPRAAPAVDRLLAALRSAAAAPGTPCAWFPPQADPVASTWRRWLDDGLADDPTRTVSGWRRRLAEHPEFEPLFEAGASRVRGLLDACPERRDLVHGDLLHQNVMLSHDLDAVTAVISWKNSVRGDFLYDIAWFTFWGPWHPGVAALDVWPRALAADADRGAAPAGPTTSGTGAAGAPDAGVRHHCYEVHIGCTHLGWSAWTGDTGALRAVAHRLEQVIERGPLAGDTPPDRRS